MVTFKTRKKDGRVFPIQSATPKASTSPQIITPLKLITGKIISPAFPRTTTNNPSDIKKRNNPMDFKKKNNPNGNQVVAFSYIDGRRLGTFKDLNDVFKRFPEERKPFNQVQKFNRQFKTRITTIKQLKDARIRISRFKKQNNPPKKKKRSVKKFVRSIYG